MKLKQIIVFYKLDNITNYHYQHLFKAYRNFTQTTMCVHVLNKHRRYLINS